MKKVFGSSPKPEICLVEPIMAWDQGLGGAVASESEKPALHPKATVCLLNL